MSRGSADGLRSCRKLQRNRAKTRQGVLKCGKKTNRSKGVAGNCNEAICVSVQGDAGNCSDGLKSNSKKTGLNYRNLQVTDYGLESLHDSPSKV